MSGRFNATKSCIKSAVIWTFLYLLKSAKVGSLLTKRPTFQKVPWNVSRSTVWVTIVFETSKLPMVAVCDSPLIFGWFFFAESVIKCAKVLQFVYVATNICLIINFQCIFHISQLMHLWSLQRWIIAEWFLIFFKTRYQNIRIY